MTEARRVNVPHKYFRLRVAVRVSGILLDVSHSWCLSSGDLNW